MERDGERQREREKKKKRQRDRERERERERWREIERGREWRPLLSNRPAVGLPNEKSFSLAAAQGNAKAKARAKSKAKAKAKATVGSSDLLYPPVFAQYIHIRMILQSALTRLPTGLL